MGAPFVTRLACVWSLSYIATALPWAPLMSRLPCRHPSPSFINSPDRTPAPALKEARSLLQRNLQDALAGSIVDREDEGALPQRGSAPDAAAEGKGPGDAAAADAAYWDLVYILYPEALETAGAAVMHELLPNRSQLEAELEARLSARLSTCCLGDLPGRRGGIGSCSVGHCHLEAVLGVGCLWGSVFCAKSGASQSWPALGSKKGNADGSRQGPAPGWLLGLGGLTAWHQRPWALSLSVLTGQVWVAAAKRSAWQGGAGRRRRPTSAPAAVGAQGQGGPSAAGGHRHAPRQTDRRAKCGRRPSACARQTDRRAKCGRRPSARAAGLAGRRSAAHSGLRACYSLGGVPLEKSRGPALPRVCCRLSRRRGSNRCCRAVQALPPSSSPKPIGCAWSYRTRSGRARGHSARRC
jgi:hypothetical protein